MIKIRVADAISVIANIGVLAGIGFLVYEIRQNTQAIRSVTIQSIADQSLGSSFIGVENRDLRLAFARAARGLEYMTPEDANILGWWYTGTMRISENRYRQAAIGALDRDFETLLGATNQAYRNPYFGAFWRASRRNYASDFAEWVDANLIPLVEDSIPSAVGPDLILPEVRDALPRDGSSSGAASIAPTTP